ncbi:MAG TPA: cupin domain-containing protein [Candidatus Acidoferrales bacterium]|nr:cupin domain-containing protein [Candidatus Acidoferrales bacterium]
MLFSLARKRIESGGWTRQVTARELPISTTIAGVEIRLTAGGVRELHWHVTAEWSIMLYGNARITAVDRDGKSFVSDVGEGDLWLFPAGVPHSIQGLGPDGCKFLLVFDDGNFDEFQTFLITDWLAHTPKEVLAKNFNVAADTFDNVPKKELFIFQTELPGDLKQEQNQAAEGTGTVPQRFDFKPSGMKPTKVTAGGEVKIIDSKIFPVTPIAAAIVRLKPGGLRELHWHPNQDEWQYYISGKGRMTVFEAGARARRLDFEEGDVGYVLQSNPHYIENTVTAICCSWRCSKAITMKTSLWRNGWRIHHIFWSTNTCTWDKRCSVQSQKKKKLSHLNEYGNVIENCDGIKGLERRRRPSLFQQIRKQTHGKPETVEVSPPSGKN